MDAMKERVNIPKPYSFSALSRCTGTTQLECYYTPKSAFYAPPIKSARITSRVSFKYGKIEIRAKLPAGDWIFPGWYLMAH